MSIKNMIIVAQIVFLSLFTFSNCCKKKKEYNSENKFLYQSFFTACKQGNTAEIKKYIRECIDINAIDIGNYAGGYMNCLLYAAQSGNTETVVLLLLNNVNINFKNRYGVPAGRTALMYATENNHYDIVQYLVSKGGNVNQIDRQKQTALNYAARKGNMVILKYLLSNGAKLDNKCKISSPLTSAAEGGHLEIIKYLLSRGMNIECYDSGNWTPLIMAAERGYFEIVKYLIENGANVNVDDRNGNNTALIKAAFNGHLKIVKYLLSRGAHLSQRNTSGVYALYYALTAGKFDVVKYLLTKNIDVNFEYNPNIYETLLMVASRNGYYDIARQLITMGAKVNTRNFKGQTALMMACDYGHLNIVRLLVTHGADANLKDGLDSSSLQDGSGCSTALDYAKMRKHVDIMNYLRSVGAR